MNLNLYMKMKILFVINNFHTKGNGLCASARRTVHFLKEAGQDVKVLSGRNSDPDGEQPEFCLEQYHLPIFDPLVTAQGYVFAKSDKKIIEEAVRWADVIHIEEPFVLQQKTIKVAKRLGVPCTATYHLHPENMTASIYLSWCRPLNNLILGHWRKNIFDHCTDIQCPTENVRQRLEKAGFKSRLHLISNGLILAEKTPAIKDNSGEKYTVLCIGRFSKEKDQETLLDALNFCVNAKKIQLYFAGRGPLLAKYEKKAKKLVEKGVLKFPPVFAFHDQAGLSRISHSADLYVHCADIEVEGLSCLEALQGEIVPILAKGEFTATSQFALDDRSVFPVKNPKALAEKIDYWIEHEQERKEMSVKYAESVQQYDIHKSISSLLEMFSEAIKN